MFLEFVVRLMQMGGIVAVAIVGILVISIKTQPQWETMRRYAKASGSKSRDETSGFQHVDGAIFRLSKAKIRMCKDGVENTAEKLLCEPVYDARALIILGKALI